MITRILKVLSSLLRRKLKFVGVNVPIVFILMAGLSILPIGMAFGEGDGEPLGNNISDKVEIFDVMFHQGGSLDSPIIENLVYGDGTPIENGDFWLSFNWRLVGPDGLPDPDGFVEYGDYFDVIIDLGLETIPAIITDQSVATIAPIIYTGNNTPAGSIKWINKSTYQTDMRVIIRIELDAENFTGIQGSEENPVRGKGVWGFMYKAGEDATGGQVCWQVNVSESDDPIGGVIVIPIPDDPVVDYGSNTNPYNEREYGYNKVGGRLSPSSTPFPDTIFYWSVQINGHKHETIEDWLNCRNNTDDNPYNDDPPPVPVSGDGSYPSTFTIVDTGRNTAPTWLRDVTESGDKPVVHPGTSLQVDLGNGQYGQRLSDTQGPAYLKLFYVNSDHIWDVRIKNPKSPFETPPSDNYSSHQPPFGEKVGAYDPYFTTWFLKEGERSSLMYAPNGSGPGGKYEGYLTPVPTGDVRSIEMTQDGFKIEMNTTAVLGKTLVIAYMSKPATDSSGYYSNDIGNSVSIIGVNDGNPLASASAGVLIAGTIDGGRLASPNRGNFVIDKRDYNSADVMGDVVFSVVASSEDPNLADAANTLIESQRNMNDPPVLSTGSDGKLAIKLPDLPWSGGKNLVLTITENDPPEHFAVKPFTVEIEPENGTVVSVTPGSGESHLVKISADNYVVEVWNRSTIKDKSFYDAALLKWIKKVDRNINNEWVNVYFRDEVNEDVVSVRNGDVILFRIDVFNHCFNPLTITEITDVIPRGLVFDSGLTIANIDPEAAAYTNDAWELIPDDGSGVVKIRYVGRRIDLEEWDGDTGNYPEFRIPLVLRVDVPEDIGDGELLTNYAEITEMYSGEEDVTTKDLTPDNNYDDASVTPHNEIILSCEVDKDTIRRTSAAYVSPPNQEDFDNIKDKETYRYNVDFRSTANIPADEFVLDDPLECVKEGQVRLEMLVTPIVWGDEDERYNLWFKTNKTKEGHVYDSATAVGQDVTPMWRNDGYRLWKQGLDTTIRYKLLVSELGLDEDEYVTALRFEFGAVKVGFTSKNYSSKSLNGENRNAEGEITLSPEDLKKLEDLTTKSPKANTAPVEPATAEVTVEEQPEGNAITRLFAGLFGKGGDDEEITVENAGIVGTAETVAFGIGGPYDGILPGDYINWTPDPMRPDYSPGAAGASGLAPISYLVSAAKPMSDEHIVTSAASRIAKGNLWDEDIDAVLTLQLTTFMMDPDEGNGLNRMSYFDDKVPRFGPNSPGGTLFGNSPKTFDEMKPLLWVVTAVASAFCAMLLMRLYNIRKRRILLAQKRGRSAI